MQRKWDLNVKVWSDSVPKKDMVIFVVIFEIRDY
jgi:hypothetical protein